VTDWSNDEAFREALIAELSAELPGEPRPGDLTAEDFAEATGITIHSAEYQLRKLEHEGRLTSAKVRWPGKRIAMRVWRRPASEAM
jgi:hypothetical protein